MNEKYIKILALAILLGGGYYVWQEYKKGKEKNAKPDLSDVDLIVSSGKNKDYNFVSTLEAGFVKAWADAIKLNSNTFIYKNKKYNSQGGKYISVK